MFSIRFFSFILFFFYVFSLAGQDRFISYWQPSIALNYKVSPNYYHNFTAVNRNYLYRDGNTQLDVRHLDLSHFSNLKIGSSQSLGFGLQYRFRKTFETDKNNEVRFTQQYNIVNKVLVLRLGHRLISEQRFFPDFTVHRFRYRFVVDRPLLGEKLDTGEPYVVAAAETLLSAATGFKPQFDQRLSGQIGWLLTVRSKIQAGLEYRLEDFGNQGVHILFINTALVLTL